MCIYVRACVSLSDANCIKVPAGSKSNVSSHEGDHLWLPSEIHNFSRMLKAMQAYFPQQGGVVL